MPAPDSNAAEFVPPPRLRTAAPQDDEIDMTPMIDVVFQLLIFFMVTSAFALQKALPGPTPESNAAARADVVAEPEEQDEAIVRVEADDSIWVDDVLSVSRQDLIAKLRRIRTTPGPRGEPGPRRLRVEADSDARHEMIVRALDAGSAAGMEEIRLVDADDGL